jgi:hypothetical protein
LGGGARAAVELPSAGLRTPESYLGARQARGFVGGPLRPGTQTFGGPPRKLPPNGLAYRSRWRIEPDSAGRGARLGLDLTAAKVFLVLESSARARTLRVLLDGKPVHDRLAGRTSMGAALGFAPSASTGSCRSPTSSATC